MGTICKVEEMVVWNEEGGGWMGGGLFIQVGAMRFQDGEGCTHGVFQPCYRGSCGSSWGRFHL
jgi:hypothetical protein